MTSTRADGRTDDLAPGPARARPLVADVLRRPLLVAGGLAVALFAVLAATVTHRTGPTALDRAVDPVVTRWFDGRWWLARDLSDLGGTAPYLVLTATATAAWLLRRRHRAAALALLAPFVAVCLVEYVLKPLVDRPYGPYLAFPSGHTTASSAVAFAFVVALVAHRVPRRPSGRTAAACGLAVLLPLLVAVGLIGAGYHYVTDVLGALLVSGVAVAGTALGIDAVASRVSRG